MAKIVVVGGYYQQMITQVELPPQAGQIALDGRFATVGGGAGNRIALSAAKHGADVTLIAAMGADAHAESARATWQHQGINAQFVQTIPAVHTGIMTHIQAEEGQPIMAVASGANRHLSNAQLDAAADVIADADLLLATLEVPANVAAYAFKLAKLRGVATLLYPHFIRDVNRATLHLADTILLDEMMARELGTRLVGKNTIVYTAQGIRWRAGESSGVIPADVLRAQLAEYWGLIAAELGAGSSIQAAIEAANSYP